MTNTQEKEHVILSFLAVLELVKNNVLSVFQDGLGADIHIEKADVPNNGTLVV